VVGNVDLIIKSRGEVNSIIKSETMKAGKVAFALKFLN
jgi:hypothetical protein